MKDWLESATLGANALVVSILYFPFYPGFPVALVVIVCGAIYALERFEKYKRDEQEQKAHDLNLQMLENQFDLLKKDHESIRKVAEEAKGLVNNIKIATSFIPKGMRS